MLIFMANEQKGTSNLDKELENLYQPKAVQAKPQARRSAAKGAAKKKTTKKPVLAKGKRKRAVARVSLIPGGNGKLTINGRDIKLMEPSEIRELILEPINSTSAAADVAKSSDISVLVYGGGFSGQAQAARTAIAKAIGKAAAAPDALRSFYMSYDRHMLVDDTREVEPKKFKGPKARARFQKSYR